MNEHSLETDPNFQYPRTTDSDRDMPEDTLLAAPPNTFSKSSKHIVRAQSRWKHSQETPLRTLKTSRVQNDAQKQQIVHAEHAVQNLTSTNVTSATLDGQLTRPTVENTVDNSIRNYRKPPDSPKSSSSTVRSTETDKRTTSVNLRDQC